MSQFSEVSVPGDTFVETVNNLRPATAYHFTIYAKNEIGLSPASKVGFCLAFLATEWY